MSGDMLIPGKGAAPAGAERRKQGFEASVLMRRGVEEIWAEPATNLSAELKKQGGLGLGQGQ